MKKIVIGNWKLNPSTLEEAERIIKLLTRKPVPSVTAVICPPAVFLSRFTHKKSHIAFGIQTLSHETSGAFTGEISATQAKSVGASVAIIGHSERRAMGESNELVSRKVFSSLKAGLTTVVCVGEKERDVHGHYLSYLKAQIDESLALVPKTLSKQLIIAYEPLYAISGAGHSALLPEELEQTVLFVRKVLHDLFGKKAVTTPILYGGSVDPINISALVKSGGVDGFLVGKESLRPEHFLSILRAVSES